MADMVDHSYQQKHFITINERKIHLLKPNQLTKRIEIVSLCNIY